MTLSQLLFGVLPYVAIIIAILVTPIRYFTRRFSYSSLSSQFLETKQLFRGSVPWHYGIVYVLVGHIVGFLIPRSVLAWNGVPIRLYVLEITALAAGLTALWGLVNLIIRRVTNSRIRAVTSKMDVLLLLVLIAQVVTGVLIAMLYRWGSTWYAGVMVPYLYSIIKLQPNIQLVENLPFIVQLHVIVAFALTILLPFSRLVHFLSIPFSYLWRPYQIVIWNRK